MKLSVVLAGAGTAALIILAACSSSGPPDAAEDTVTNDTRDAGSPSALADGGVTTPAEAGTRDGGDAGPLIIDCTTSTQTGAIVQAIGQLGGLPDGRGGTIAPGDYMLLAVNEYGGNESDAGDDDGVTERETDDYAQKTISLSANGAFHRIEASGHGGTVGAPTISGGTWTTTDAGLVLTTGCTGGTTETIPYYFAGRNLYLFRTSPTATQEQYVTP